MKAEKQNAGAVMRACVFSFFIPVQCKPSAVTSRSRMDAHRLAADRAFGRICGGSKRRFFRRVDDRAPVRVHGHTVKRSVDLAVQIRVMPHGPVDLRRGIDGGPALVCHLVDGVDTLVFGPHASAEAGRGEHGAYKVFRILPAVLLSYCHRGLQRRLFYDLYLQLKLIRRGRDKHHTERIARQIIIFGVFPVIVGDAVIAVGRDRVFAVVRLIAAHVLIRGGYIPPEGSERHAAGAQLWLRKSSARKKTAYDAIRKSYG